MPRIISGHAKGRQLRAPRGNATRPTGARVRQSLFDMLGERVSQARVLDLCAGTGAVGIEALSRGATTVVLVERSARVLATVRVNLRALGALAGRAEVCPGDCLAVVKRLALAGRRFDIVFFDPPYESGLYQPVMEEVDRGGVLAGPESLLVVEHFHKRLLPETMGRLARSRSTRIGDHCLSIYGLTLDARA